MINIPKIACLDIEIPSELSQAIINVYNNHKDKILKRNTSPPLEILPVQSDQSNEWLFDDNDVNVVRTFLEKNFDSAIGFRIHMWDTGGMNQDVGHDHPRVFIPITNSNCVYIIIDEHGIRHKLQFEVGKCYVWDVRYDHAVYMPDNVPRIVGIFLFDPNTESIYKGI